MERALLARLSTSRESDCKHSLSAFVPAGLGLILARRSKQDALADDLLAAGAAGFLLKTAPSAVLLAAIEMVLAGGRYRPEKEVRYSVRAAAASTELPQLSGRLADVASLLGDRLTNKQIARAWRRP